MWFNREVRVLVLIVGACVACAPEIGGPAERQRAVDREDSVRLGVQLGELPGAVRADVALHRPVTDPLTQKVSPASGAIVVVADDAADRAGLEASARKLARATAPEIPEAEIAVVVGAKHVEVARVGPFTVAVESKRALQAVLAGAFVVIAGLAGWIAWRERQRSSQR